MKSAMEQQEERIMKALEIRDANDRRREVINELGVRGLEGVGNVIQMEDLVAANMNYSERTHAYKNFLCNKPPEFSGTDSPAACLNWIQEMEQAFDSSECEEGQKAKFASRMMRGRALTWWNVTKTAMGIAAISSLTWDTFKKEVLKEYCSEMALDRIEEEFRALKKGDMTMKVRCSKASTLRKAMEESLFVEDMHNQGEEEEATTKEKRGREDQWSPSQERDDHGDRREVTLTVIVPSRALSVLCVKRRAMSRGTALVSGSGKVREADTVCLIWNDTSETTDVCGSESIESLELVEGFEIFSSKELKLWIKPRFSLNLASSDEPYTELSLAVVPRVSRIRGLVTLVVTLIRGRVLDGPEWRVELGRSSDRMALVTSSGLVKIAYWWF
ncbi:hypothetical protein L6452_33913 [Arctium lappa]|uniref:Uncharacterized protein n=1 Tax=Arctium lappa TaxID=4217 RepID=A0ACB8YGX5_ARCLA|nr:hypothetical protein L6452_33913 [Arctium lappa]